MKSSPPEKISVVIVDDHRMFREHLGHLIDKSGDMVVCGEADNVEDGFALIQEKRPSVAIVDISLKGSSGLELIDLAVRVEPSIEVVFIDTHYHFPETLSTVERVRRSAPI